MKKVYPIEIAKHTDDILFAPSDLAELKEIDLIYFGQHSCPAKVEKTYRQKETIILTENLAMH